MTTSAIINTDRLILRPLIPEDRTPIMAGLNDFDVNYWTMHTSWPYTDEDADIWFDEQSYNGLHRAIELDGEFIGEIGLTGDADKGYNLGYWLVQAHWGHGYMSEALTAFLDYIATAHNITEIGLNYHHENNRSARVAAKLGFSIIGKRMVASQAHGFDYLEIMTRRTYRGQK